MILLVNVMNHHNLLENPKQAIATMITMAMEEKMTDQSVWRVGGECGVSMTVYMYKRGGACTTAWS